MASRSAPCDVSNLSAELRRSGARTYWEKLVPLESNRRCNLRTEICGASATLARVRSGRDKYRCKNRSKSVMDYSLLSGLIWQVGQKNTARPDRSTRCTGVSQVQQPSPARAKTWWR